MPNYNNQNDNKNKANRENQNGFVADDMSELIKRNIQKKTEENHFQLDIEDEDFYKIPDFENLPPPPQDNFSNQQNPLHNTNANQQGHQQRRMPQNTRRQPENVKKFVPKKIKKRKQSSKVFGGLSYAIIVVGVSVFLSIFLIQSIGDFLGLYKTPNTAEIEIKPSDDFAIITKALKDNNIITQPFTFSLYGTVRKKNVDFNEGIYTLNSDMSYDEILSILRASNKATLEVQVTVVEGRTVPEMAKILEKDKVTEKQKFYDAVNNREAFYEWEKNIPNDDLRFFKYEGYLFPDTFNFYVNEKGDSVVRKYVNGFNNKVMTPETENRLKELNMTLDELITLASLIEREGSGFIDEMPKISAIFHNRLNNKGVYPKLQSDVTIKYLEDNIKPFMDTSAEYEKYTAAYNTYKVDGLPLGPIGNPGEAAIRAALYPDEELNGFYFFLTDIEMKFYYAKTYDDHMVNDAVAAKVKDEAGKSQVGGIATQGTE